MLAKSTITARPPAANVGDIHDDPPPSSVSVCRSCDVLKSSSANLEVETLFVSRQRLQLAAWEAIADRRAALRRSRLE